FLPVIDHDPVIGLDRTLEIFLESARLPAAAERQFVRPAMFKLVHPVDVGSGLEQDNFEAFLCESHAHPSTTGSGTDYGNVVLLHCPSNSTMFGMSAARKLGQICVSLVFEHVNDTQ